jgi:hypothetical protein
MSNEKEYQEPEEKEMNTQVMDDFSPFDEPVSEKPYTRHNVSVDAKDFANPIPEPSFMPPPMNGSTLSQEEKVKKDPPKPINKEMNELPKKDRYDAAEKVSEMIMSAYKWGNTWADRQLLFDETKIAKMQREGEIDLNAEIPISPYQSIPAGEFIKEYNDQTKGTIVVTKEFEEEVTPILTRVLEKRGIGFTDEQYLYYMFGKDLLVKGFMMKQSLNVKKEMLNTMREFTQLLRGGATPPPPRPQAQPQEPTPPPPSTPQYEYTPSHNPDTNVNDFVNQMTGSIVPQLKNEMDYQEPMVVDSSDVEVFVEKKKVKKGRPSKKA